ncbi:hypothetical protein PV797_19455 [Clostridiaceae bacterium M8S5]|nr:hypothetical protein PV797_19455 [Clostridiaceae bacterium M8S5]
MRKIFVFFVVMIFLIVSCKKNESVSVIKRGDGYKTLLASIDDENIYLYGKEVSGSYNSMKLVIGDNSKIFDWRNTGNILGYAPKITLHDINNDGKDELVITRVEGYGTGIYNGTINILNIENFKQMDIEAPIDIIKKNVKSRISLTEIKIDIKGEEISLDPKKYTNNKNTYKEVEFGWQTYYNIKDNKIRAKVSAQITPAAYIGYIVIDYKCEGNKLVLGDIGFKKINNL